MSNHNIAPQPVPSSPQQYQPQQPQPQPPQPQHLHTTICGIAAVVFGALGLVLSFIPIVNNIAAILGFIGVILAIIAIVGTFRGKKRGKVLSIVAAVLSVLAIVITLAMQSAASKAIDDSIKESKGIDTSQSSSSKSAGKSSDASKSKASEQKAQGEQDLEGDIEGAHVKIVSAVKSVNDYNGKPTALVTYEWTNNTSKNNSFATLAHPNVFQNGTELETAVYFDQPEGYDANSYEGRPRPRPVYGQHHRGWSSRHAGKPACRASEAGLCAARRFADYGGCHCVPINGSRHQGDAYLHVAVNRAAVQAAIECQSNLKCMPRAWWKRPLRFEMSRTSRSIIFMECSALFL